MPEIQSLHVICHREGALPKGLVLLDPKQHLYESISWRVTPEQSEKLIGARFALHETKSSPSYFGGEILQIDHRPIADNDGEVRAVVQFRATHDARGISWPPTDNPNEFVRVHPSLS